MVGFAALELSLGLLALLLALPSARRVIQLLPPGQTRRAWVGLFGLILFFSVSYIGCGVCLIYQEITPWFLISTTIFLGGGIFVLVVCRLALSAVEIVRRAALLEQENITDPLMGIYNRRYFDRRIEEAVSRSKRYGVALSLLMIDVDHFKRVNDEHGHLCGDEVLVNLGARLGEGVRSTDIVARYGGEEVVTLTSDTGLEGALILAERLRASVASTPLVDGSHTKDNAPLFKTISVGVACLDESMPDSAAFIAAADAALYEAKRAGRDRVCAWRGGEAGPA